MFNEVTHYSYEDMTLTTIKILDTMYRIERHDDGFWFIETFSNKELTAYGYYKVS